MTRRFPGSLITSGGALALVIGILSLAPTPAASQTSLAAAKTKTAATAKTRTQIRTQTRTADGHPDLQGIWSNAVITPLERPAELAGKPVLTEQEAAAYEKQMLERNNVDRREEVGTDLDVARAYNESWWDRGTKVVKSRRTSLIVDPPDGRIPPLTPEAQRHAADRAEARQLHPADGPEDRALNERCILTNTTGPPMLPGPYNNNYQIVQTPGSVVIFNEMIHETRTIPLDGRPHLPKNIRQWKGDSIGHWEGDTLVVDTTNFTDKTNFRGSGENLHLVERFTRADANTLLYEFTVDDPASFTRPWTAAIASTKTEGPIFEFACHEGNYGMRGLLSAARAEEKKAAENKGTR
jgi:hypothetical protein